MRKGRVRKGKGKDDDRCNGTEKKRQEIDVMCKIRQKRRRKINKTEKHDEESGRSKRICSEMKQEKKDGNERDARGQEGMKIGKEMQG